MSLEAEMREGLVGFCHTVDFITLLDSAATVFCSFDQFGGQTGAHGFFRALTGSVTDPAHGQGHTTRRTDLDRHLVVGTTDAAGLHFYHRLGVVQRLGKHFQRITATLVGDLVKGAINGALSDRLLAGDHQNVNKLGHVNIAELRIRQNVTLGYFATTRHGYDLSVNGKAASLERVLSSFGALGAVLRTGLLTI